MTAANHARSHSVRGLRFPCRLREWVIRAADVGWSNTHVADRRPTPLEKRFARPTLTSALANRPLWRRTRDLMPLWSLGCGQLGVASRLSRSAFPAWALHHHLSMRIQATDQAVCKSDIGRRPLKHRQRDPSKLILLLMPTAFEWRTRTSAPQR